MYHFIAYILLNFALLPSSVFCADDQPQWVQVSSGRMVSIDQSGHPDFTNMTIPVIIRNHDDNKATTGIAAIVPFQYSSPVKKVTNRRFILPLHLVERWGDHTTNVIMGYRYRTQGHMTVPVSSYIVFDDVIIGTLDYKQQGAPFSYLDTLRGEQGLSQYFSRNGRSLVWNGL